MAAAGTAAGFVAAVESGLPARAYAEDTDATDPTTTDPTTPEEAPLSMWRLYNPNSGEHFYTSNTAERDNVTAAGWTLEGVGWLAPATGDPVYRLYNPNAGDHHYTMSASERDHLISVGWRDEGVGWYSDPKKRVALLRQYNPNAKAGAHNFTTSQSENDYLVSVGWRAEGIGWYGVGEGVGTHPIMGASQVSAVTMAAWYKAQHKTYPTALADNGAAGDCAPTIDDFARIVYEEATTEGVRAEVVFAQAMWETGWLQFGGQVQVEQNNFAGLGATDDGAHGATFSSVREGIRAQVQHLKLYASKDPLVNTCVDPRWDAAVWKYGRGTATTVEALGGKWATGQGYGIRVSGLVDQLVKFKK